LPTSVFSASFVGLKLLTQPQKLLPAYRRSTSKYKLQFARKTPSRQTKYACDMLNYLLRLIWKVPNRSRHRVQTFTLLSRSKKKGTDKLVKQQTPYEFQFT